MTRRDYELIASALYEVRSELDDSSQSENDRALALAVMRRVNAVMADALRTTNPRFDRNRFMMAAEGSDV